MTKQLLRLIAFGAALSVAATQAQTSSGSSQDTSGSGSKWDSSKHFSATGRMGHQDVRATKLIGSDVKSSSGEELGTINDVILNPASGRIEFGVLSLSSTSSTGTSSTGTTGTSRTSGNLGSSGTSGTSSTSGTSGTSGSTYSSSSSSMGKLAAVPWSLLRPSGAAGYSATSTSQQSFVFTGDKSKLESAPTFDQSSWPDITQPTWRQNIYSTFGVEPGSATGGASSPGGASSSSGSSTRPSSSPDTGKP